MDAITHTLVALLHIRQPPSNQNRANSHLRQERQQQIHDPASRQRVKDLRLGRVNRHRDANRIHQSGNEERNHDKSDNGTEFSVEGWKSGAVGEEYEDGEADERPCCGGKARCDAEVELAVFD